MAEEVRIVQSAEVEQITHIALRPDLPLEAVRWGLGLRTAFRFCFTYLTLFSLSDLITGLFLPPQVDVPDLGTLWPLRQITFWTATHVFKINHPLVYTDTGSGDKTFDWVQTFCLLVLATVITAIWSVLDRRRANYVTLYKWFRLFMRFALASMMLSYGLIKIIPVQMPFPPLFRLLEPMAISLPFPCFGFPWDPPQPMKFSPAAPRPWAGSC